MSDSLSSAAAIVLSGIGATILAAILAYCTRINAKLDKQGEEIIALKTQISPLWARVQAQIAADLHQPHPRYIEMDTLLERLEHLTITDAERARLKVLLVERSQDMHADISAGQRQNALLMIQIMDKVLIEAAEATSEPIRTDRH